MLNLLPLLNILKAGNTGHRGGQYGNQNARRDAYDSANAPEEEVTKKYEDMRNRWFSDTTPDQQTAVARYSLSSTKMNMWLRGQSKNSSHKWNFQQMLSAMRPTDEDLILYRGTGPRLPLTVGSVQKYRGFTSTSLSKKFVDTATLGNVARIFVPKGTPVLYGMYGLDYRRKQDWNVPPEYEIILPPWSHFKVAEGKNTIDRLLPSREYHELEYIPTRHDLKTMKSPTEI